MLERVICFNRHWTAQLGHSCAAFEVSITCHMMMHSQWLQQRKLSHILCIVSARAWCPCIILCLSPQSLVLHNTMLSYQ